MAVSMSPFEYAGWAGFGPGSTVTWDDETIHRKHFDIPESVLEEHPEFLSPMPEMSIHIHAETRATLVERLPDRIVLEIATRTVGAGEVLEATRREVLHASPPTPEAEVHEETLVVDEDGGSASVVKHSWNDLFKDVPSTEGQETLEVAGRSLPCRWIERSGETPIGPLKVKSWHCDEVPGGIVRLTFEVEGPGGQTMDTRIRSFERK